MTNRPSRHQITVGYYRKDPTDPYSERVPYVKNVPSVWYNSLQKARKARQKVEEKYLSKSWCRGIGISPGEGMERSKIVLYVDEAKADVISNIPNTIRGVQTLTETIGDIQPACNVNQLRNWDYDNEPCYGGYEINVKNGDFGTHAIIVFDSNGAGIYGLTANHVLEEPGNAVRGGSGNYIGRATNEQHCRSDWGLYETGGSGEGFTNQVKYSGYDIVSGSFSKDGSCDLKRQGATCSKVGKRTCETHFKIIRCNIEILSGGQCATALHQNKYEGTDSDFENGDSGSLVYHVSPENNSYCWAVGLANYHDPNYLDGDLWGVGAWRITGHGYNF